MIDMAQTSFLSMPAPLRFGPYCLKRGPRVLAEGVSLSLQAGQYIELLGENGTGKTSLLHVLAGVVDARDRFAQWSAPVGRFFYAHLAGFHPEWTVQQQFTQSLAMYGVSMPIEAQWACLEQVGIKRYATALVKTLSHGQQRRLLLAIMVASKQRLWLIDEPINALDAAGRALFCACLIMHLQQGGMAVIATHQPLTVIDEAMAAWCAGALLIENKKAQWHPRAKGIAVGSSQATSATAFNGPRQAKSWAGPLKTLCYREWALLASRPADMLWPMVFFLMVVTLFPFGSGAGRDVLAIMGVPVMWMATLLSVLMALGRTLADEARQGSLVQWQVAGGSFQVMAWAKWLFLSVCVGLPLALLSLGMSPLYHLSPAQSWALAGSIFAGVPVLLGLGLFFSALALLSRQAHLMTNLLALPLYVPVLIFGTSVALRAETNPILGAPMGVLVGLDVLTCLVMPWLIAKAIHLAIE